MTSEEGCYKLPLWVLGIQLGFSPRTTSDLNCWAFSPAPSLKDVLSESFSYELYCAVIYGHTNRGED